MMEKVTVSREHTTLDLLLFRRFGAAGQFLLESVLDANRGLAAKGPVLPVGTIVTLPEQLGRTSTGERPVVDLFG
jgi:phage tail protein X|tara:strand:- start:31219 stop:31443 length:225 start_codon:yes stop_codon:yes gene_type:complete